MCIFVSFNFSQAIRYGLGTYYIVAARVWKSFCCSHRTVEDADYMTLGEWFHLLIHPCHRYEYGTWTRL